MRTPLPLTHPAAARATDSPHLVRRKAAFHIGREQRQIILDKLAVFAALLLILATFTMISVYVVNQWPVWRSGQIGSFDAMASLDPQPSPPAAAASSTDPATTSRTLSRVPLVLISTAIEMGIFIALGLYLRHEMNRMP